MHVWALVHAYFVGTFQSVFKMLYRYTIKGRQNIISTVLNKRKGSEVQKTVAKKKKKTTHTIEPGNHFKINTLKHDFNSVFYTVFM